MKRALIARLAAMAVLCAGLGAGAYSQESKSDLNLQANEARLIEQAMTEAHGDTAAAARRLGISEAALKRKLRKTPLSPASPELSQVEKVCPLDTPMSIAAIDLKLGTIIGEIITFAHHRGCIINDFDAGVNTFARDSRTNALVSGGVFINCFDSSRSISITRAMFEACFPQSKILKYKVILNGRESQWLFR